MLSPEALERSATEAARRVHQGIPLEAFLHAFRLWSQIFSEQGLAEARTDRPGEREAALRIAGLLMTHVDWVSSAGELAYLDEVQGSGATRRSCAATCSSCCSPATIPRRRGGTPRR